jgi:hypothetical protein
MPIGIIESGIALLLSLFFLFSLLQLTTKKKENIYAEDKKEIQETQPAGMPIQDKDTQKEIEELQKKPDTLRKRTLEHIEAQDIEEDMQHNYHNFYSTDEQGMPTEVDRASEKVDIQWIHKNNENTYYISIGFCAIILLIVFTMGL